MENLEKKIERFLSNEADAKEGEEVFLYFRQHPEVLEQYISNDDLLKKTNDGKIAAELTRSVADRLKEYIENTRKLRRPHRLWIRYAVAAAFAGTLILTTYRWLTVEKPVQDKYRAGADISKSAVPATGLITIENRNTGNEVVCLDDGSEVTLNKEAKISFSKPFGMNDRHIELTGNAVFKVAKDTLKPFCVISRGITTIAVGTEFRIEPAEHGIRINLYEGKVKVQKQGKTGNATVLMVQGQVLKVDSVNFTYSFEEKKKTFYRRLLPRKDSSSINEMNAPPDMLVFRKATLQEVFTRIEEKFDIEIIYKDSDIKTKPRFTGRFKKDELYESIMASICSLNDLTYSMNGNTITVTK